MKSIFTWSYFLRIALRHRQQLVFANLVAILATSAGLMIPLLLPLLVDEVLLEQPGFLVGQLNQLFPADWHGPWLYIGAIALFTIFLRVLGLGLHVLHSRQFTLIAKDVTFRMRRRLLKRLPRIAMRDYETMGPGSVTSHFVTDVDAIDQFLGVTVSKFIVALLSLIGVAIVLLWLNWQLGLFILLLNPLVVFFTVSMGKRVKDLKKHENQAYELFQQALSETLEAIQQLRAANREQRYVGKVIERAATVKQHAAAFSWKSDAASRFSFTIFLSGFDIFRASAMLMVVLSDLTIGQMFAVFGYLWFMMGPVQEILNIQYAWFGANAALGRINSLFNLQPETQYPLKQNPFANQTTVGLDLHNIHFAYGDGPEVLSNINLQIKPGEKIALVGASGGGKTTLAQLLLGLYRPQQGQIRFGGVSVEEIGYETVRKHVAMVLQSPALFNDSIRANLCLGHTHNDEQLWQALEIAQLASVVRDLNEQLDTLVGRNGIRLSGGQRQRLAIARMVLDNPQLVILDEATSALDTQTEKQLHEAMEAFLKNRTTLIIAHRLSAVKRADRIYVMEDGHIIEHGQHHELIANGGLYEQLYGNLQI